MATAERYIDKPTGSANRRAAIIRAWLISVAALVFAMVLVGGATRLTDSGLSITEWQPIAGVLPPLSDAAWNEAFAKYQQIPEYQKINKGMSLGGFKAIFWWEWSHRFLGRFIGLAFALPLLVFWLRGWLGSGLRWKLAAILSLGALQGLMGWYMVMSGLVERMDVSQYRLAAHLGLAGIILAALAWVIFDGSACSPRNSGVRSPSALIMSAAGLAGLIFVQILAGAFVAGLDAGFMFNTWPLMDGRLVPAGLAPLTPWYANLFENQLTVQFNHRLIAYFAILWGLAHCALVLRLSERATIRTGALLLAVGLVAQATLGIWTLVAAVPLNLGLAHQAGAFALLVLALWHLHGVNSTGPER